jgi:uncharacterized protein (TIGR02453 family)
LATFNVHQLHCFMSYFTQDYLDFFKELAANNNKNWFDANRKRYEKSVKNPFKSFTEALIDASFKGNNNAKIEAKDAIFRINRDIRFAKDKTPYKTQMSAIISSGGKKDKTSPGLYYEMGPEHIRVYGGVYMMEKDQLLAVRTYIANNLNAFSNAISNTAFVKTYGEIRGEKNKVLPKELAEAAKKQALLFNKSFYYFTTLDPQCLTDDKLVKIIMANYEKAAPIRTFLEKALKSV